MKLFVHLALGATLLACGRASVQGTTAAGAGPAGAGAPDAGPVISLSDASTEVATPAPSGTCAEDVHRAESVPVDLLLLVDTSGSMNESAGARSKWSLVHDALVGFVRDPKSAGLGIGLQFFPLVQECAADGDCGAGPGACVRSRACAGAMPPAGGGMPTACIRTRSGGEICPAGTTCVTVGRCSVSGVPCYAVGQPCSGGAPDQCQTAPGVCAAGESCATARYQTLAVPIAALPAGATPVAQRLDAVTPRGGTPTGAAVTGALAQARAHQAANPGHRVALVMATDGLPSECAPMDGPGIAALLAAAQAASPPIGTYVIGVFTQEEAPMATGLLQQFATAGGSGAAFVLDASADLGQKFQEALDKIRGAALPCEFTIPPPSGGKLDFAKVNVRYQAGAGPAADLPYVGAADRCDPARGGWYYDVPPATGTPSRVLICPASCTRFKSDAAANVSLVFGCATRVIE